MSRHSVPRPVKARTLAVTCGNHRHPQPVSLSAVASIEDDVRPDHEYLARVAPESVVLRLKPRRWIRDSWGDGQWHGTVSADRAAVAAVLFPERKRQEG